MSTITILHLTDLHFKRTKEEKTPGFHGEIKRKMISAIKGHLQTNPGLDFVAITGDIAYDGKDYSEAEAFFNELRLVLPDTVIYLPVPGNHDVDRKQVDEFLSMYEIIKKDQMDRFLVNEKKIREAINVKFQSFREFVAKLNPSLYPSDTDYFWARDFTKCQVSFLGLNSAWASEGDQDQMKIALGYPQVIKALEEAKESNRIVLLHHPPYEWLDARDMEKCRKELFKNCRLLLCGHTHSDQALVIQDPVISCIVLGANASYTNDQEGFIGFQFLQVTFQDAFTRVKVWPYLYEERNLDFIEDRNRYGKAQGGQEYFELSTEKSVKIIDKTELPLFIPDDYREWVREFHSNVTFDQLAKRGEALPVQILNVYIPLETSNPFYKPEQEKEKKAKSVEVAATATDEMKEPANIDIEELLGRVNCLLLRGNAGMGKTNLVKHLVASVIQDSGPPTLAGYLPVLIFLKELWLVYNEVLNQTSPKKILLEELLPVYLEKARCPLTLEVIHSFLSQGKALVLFDGLDEVPENLRESLVGLIYDFCYAHKKNRFLLTGRPHGVAGKAEECFGKHLREINPLDPSKIEEFIRKWFRAVSQKAEGVAQATAEGLLADIGGNEHIAALTENPLLLTAVCVLYLAGKKIPEQRADLYDRIVENLLWRRFHDPGKPGLDNLVKVYLMSLAFRMQDKNRRTMDEYEARNVLKEKIPPNNGEKEDLYLIRINQLFGEIESNCGLLNRESGGAIGFSHLTFQEFLAAKYIVNMDKDYREFIGQDWWEETLVLYMGYINLNSDERSNNIVKELLNDRGSRLWLLGAKALRDYQPEKRYESVINLARERLSQLIGSSVDLKERFEAGELLGAFGDPRLKEDNMILVRAGEFTRGSFQWEDTKPIRQIYLDDFWIGKYQVTNEEFKVFIEMGGYQTQKWWSPEGWYWREKSKISEPAFWHNRKWNGLNFPVVGVSWYEAEAYMIWLSDQSGENYRLPTEAEWEKAARGVKGWTYPWGNGLIAEYKGLGDPVLLRTYPVGILNSGKSPYGCYEMAGNVWEWCLDWYIKDFYRNSPNKNPKGPDHNLERVIRGGCWGSIPEHYLTAYRYFCRPAGRNESVGFRLVRS